MRLFGGIFNDRQPPRFYGGEHDVDGRADRNHVEINRIAEQMLRFDVDHGVFFHRHFRAERFKPFDVLINRTKPEIAAAGHGDLRFVETTDQRAD